MISRSSPLKAWRRSNTLVISSDVANLGSKNVSAVSFQAETASSLLPGILSMPNRTSAITVCGLPPSGFRESHGVHRRQIRSNGLPGIAAVVTDPDRTRGGAECQTLAGLIDIQTMAVDQVVGVLLRQALPQRLECLAAVAGPIDHNAAIGRAAFLVLECRHEPRGVRSLRMDGHGKSEHRRFYIRDLRPRRGAVCGLEYAIVMLNPEHLRISGTLHQAMYILPEWIALLFGRS